MHARAPPSPGPRSARRNHQRPGVDGGRRLRHVAGDQGAFGSRARRVDRRAQHRGAPVHPPHLDLRSSRLDAARGNPAGGAAFRAGAAGANAARWDREKHFPKEALKGLAAMGLYGVAIAQEWDGAGLDYTSLAVACEEIAAGDCSTATIIAVNNLVAGILAGYGNEAQKHKFLKPVAKGEMLGAFALTEPHVGSDAAAITTRAERQGAHYVLNGVKQFITSGKNADLTVVFAVTDRNAGKRCISAFVVPTSTPGYVVARIEEKTGQGRRT